MKKYSLPYWCKQKLSWESKPEEAITKTITTFAAGGETDLEFSGSPLELLNAIYIEWRKKVGSVHGALFPTPLDVADELAELVGVGPSDTVFDPGCGLGNLIHAAKKRGALAYGVECQYWIPPMADALDMWIQRGDYLDGYKLPAEYPFTCVLTNPPFGNVWGVADATAAFLAKLATQCPGGTRIGAILPCGYAASAKPKTRVEALKHFVIEHVADLPAATFKPLTSARTEMVLMRRLPTAAPDPVPSRIEFDPAALTQGCLL